MNLSQSYCEQQNSREIAGLCATNMSLMEASCLHMNKEHFLHHTMLACYANFYMDQMWKKPFFCMHVLAMQATERWLEGVWGSGSAGLG